MRILSCVPLGAKALPGHQVLTCGPREIADHVQGVDVVVPGVDGIVNRPVLDQGSFGLVLQPGVGIDTDRRRSSHRARRLGCTRTGRERRVRRRACGLPGAGRVPTPARGGSGPRRAEDRRACRRGPEGQDGVHHRPRTCRLRAGPATPGIRHDPGGSQPTARPGRRRDLEGALHSRRAARRPSPTRTTSSSAQRASRTLRSSIAGSFRR